MTRTKNAFQARCRSTLQVAGTGDRFPVHRIFCVGRNYAEHAREMGSDPDREPPFFFSKSAGALREVGAEDGAGIFRLEYPPRTEDLHHEVELVVAIGRDGFEIEAEQATKHVFGYATGNDLTRRDLQAAAKEKRRPWDLAKGFEGSALCTPLHRLDDVGSVEHGRIWLEVDGDLRQEGDLSELIWSVPEIIADLSSYGPLRAGDLIYTGTPAGVGALEVGQRVSSGIEGLADQCFEVVDRVG